MIEQQSLRGAALYNPHLHGKDELISLFVARRELLDLLVSDLRATASGKTPQHHLILGQRGMGKTMLLRRLAYAIEDDPTLSKKWLALTFPEEQYNVARLSDFWLNCADALSDLLESRGQHAEAERLDEAAEGLRSLAEEPRAKRALALLVDTAKRISRRLVFLVDNVDLVLDRVSDQEWTLRETLSSQPALVLIGASANAIESSFTYNKAFYDFFRVHELGSLSLDETRQLLVHYAEVWNAPVVKRVAEQESARIQVLHNLTGGNPRTIVLLFNVLAAGVDGDVRTDLERLLDQSTPLYKARFEALAPQAQQVVHALAVHWDPISAGELAEQLQMDVNASSSHLARLVKQGVVEKVAYDPESKTGFQIAERFFNIWYLMRASRRVRRRLVWLVEFLRMFYSQDELRAKALLHIQASLALETAGRLRHAEYGFALADAIQEDAWRSSLERAGLYALAGDDVLQSQLSELVDLEESGLALKRTADLLLRFERARATAAATRIDLPDWTGEEVWAGLKESLSFPLLAKVRIVEELPTRTLERLISLKQYLASEPERLERQYACPVTMAALVTAVRTGIMTDPWDVEGAARAESVLGAPGLVAITLANILDVSRGNRELLPLLEKHLESTTSPYPWLVWLRCCSQLGQPPQSAKLKRAIERSGDLGRGNAGVLCDLGQALFEARLFGDAEAVLRRAIELDATSSTAWLFLSSVLAMQWRTGEAEEAARKAIALDQGDAVSWGLLAMVLVLANRNEEAEKACRKALELEENAMSWAAVGLVAFHRGDRVRAEEACRLATEHGASRLETWVMLGTTMASSGRLDEAEQAYRRAVEVAPNRAQPSEELAWFLAEHGRYGEAAELVRPFAGASYRADGILAVVLVHEGKWDEAAARARIFLTQQVNYDRVGNFPRTLLFFREAVRAGKARAALEILEETGAAQTWRPLAEALRSVVRGSQFSLRRVAPEVREPAKQILAQLMEPGPEARKSPKRPRKAGERKGKSPRPAARRPKGTARTAKRRK